MLGAGSAGEERLMALSFTPLHPTFAAEVSPIVLRETHDEDTFPFLAAP